MIDLGEGILAFIGLWAVAVWGQNFIENMFAKKKISVEKQKNEEEDIPGEMTSFYWNHMAGTGPVYIGTCPECEGLGKDRQPCPNCHDENAGKMVTPLKVLLEKYPEFFLSHIKVLEMKGGEITL